MAFVFLSVWDISSQQQRKQQEQEQSGVNPKLLRLKNHEKQQHKVRKQSQIDSIIVFRFVSHQHNMIHLDCCQYRRWDNGKDESRMRTTTHPLLLLLPRWKKKKRRWWWDNLHHDSTDCCATPVRYSLTCFATAVATTTRDNDDDDEEDDNDATMTVVPPSCIGCPLFSSCAFFFVLLCGLVSVVVCFVSPLPSSAMMTTTTTTITTITTTATPLPFATASSRNVMTTAMMTTDTTSSTIISSQQQEQQSDNHHTNNNKKTTVDDDNDDDNGTVPTMKNDASSAPVTKRLSWEFANGSVTLTDPWKMGNGNLLLTNPELLGSGGGGAVFAMTPVYKNNNNINSNNPQQQRIGHGPSSRVALKISWTQSAGSVQNECNILRLLAERQQEQKLQSATRTTTSTHSIIGGGTNDDIVRRHSNDDNDYYYPHVEQCLVMEPYPYNTKRTMIVLAPVLEAEEPNHDSSRSNNEGDDDDDNNNLRHGEGVVSFLFPVSQLSSVSKTNGAQSMAIRGIVETLIQLLSARIVTTDVQFLISPITGHVLLIDLTEAKSIANNNNDDSSKANNRNDQVVQEQEKLLMAHNRLSLLSNQERILVNNFIGEVMALFENSDNIEWMMEARQALVQELCSRHGAYDNKFMSDEVLEIVLDQFGIDKEEFLLLLLKHTYSKQQQQLPQQ